MVSIAQLHQYFLQNPAIATDTRKIKNGDLFFALKGPNFNGNVFAEKALQLGASFAIIDEVEYATQPNILLVDDVLKSLQALALYHRKQFNIPVLAITGSNGKTTTKELVHAVLSTTFKTYTTEGNLNNHIGVPLTLLSIQQDAEMAVIEMGANHQKEIESYCAYTLPTHGLITNCGKAHLEGFGGIEGVRKGKGELFDFLRTNDGVAFACSDFDYFTSMTAELKKLHWYGTSAGEIIGRVLQSEPFLLMEITKGLASLKMIRTQLVGSYNIYNVLAAVAVGIYFKVDESNIIKAIESYTPTNSRSQLVEKDGNHIILDAYNANPTSMSAAIENFARINANNKILFIGGMMELGAESLEEHQQIITLIKRYNWKDVILVGGDFERLSHPFHFFKNATEAAQWWTAKNDKGNYLLVKGSRSMQMEKIMG